MEKFKKQNCNQKRKIDGMYNEQLHYNCLQQLLTLKT